MSDTPISTTANSVAGVATAKATATATPAIAAGELVATGVGKTYGAAHLEREVVRDCSFTIERGKLTVMIGPSGCGKSTDRKSVV